MEIDGLAATRRVLAWRGVAAIMFGAVTLVLPDVTLDALLLLFGTYVLIESVLHVAEGVRDRSEHRSWGLSVFRGLLSLAAGIVTFALPGPRELALLGVIGVWALASGISETVAAMRLDRPFGGVAPLVLNGVLSTAFGIVTILMPEVSALLLVWLIGAYAVAGGVLVLGAALRLRRWSTSPAATAAPVAGALLALDTARSSR